MTVVVPGVREGKPIPVAPVMSVVNKQMKNYGKASTSSKYRTTSTIILVGDVSEFSKNPIHVPTLTLVCTAC